MKTVPTTYLTEILLIPRLCGFTLPRGYSESSSKYLILITLISKTVVGRTDRNTTIFRVDTKYTLTVCGVQARTELLFLSFT